MLREVSQPNPPRVRRPRAPALVLLGLAALSGCGKPAVHSKKDRDNTAVQAAAAEDALASATEALYKSTDLTSCRAAVQQLNTYLNRHPDKKPAPLSQAEQARVETDFAANREELAEINLAAFTALDAHYLEACFLLRDAARGLRVDGLPPLEQARAAFGWVMRQVRLEEKPIPPVPELYALRRGRGSEDERARVFLALLQQLGIDGCLVRVPHETDQASVRVWPGVVADKAVYLFDAQLGLPLPGPQGQGVATLVQLKKEPALVAQLTVDAKHPYDVKPAQLKNADVVWYCPLTALAPRMGLLEGLLRERNSVRLTVDPKATLERVRAAAGDVPVLTSDNAGRALLPARFLRYFLPTAEGGADQAQPFPLQALEGFIPAAAGSATAAMPMTQLDFFRLELGPWKALPESLKVLRWQTPQGIQIRGAFADQFSRFLLAPQGPRDLLLRGHYEEATRALTTERDQCADIKVAARSQPHLEADTARWCEAVNAAYDKFGRAQRDAQQNKEGAGEALQEANQELEQLVKGGQQRLSLVVLKALTEPREVEIDFASALCKHEQAELADTALRRAGGAKGDTEKQAARAAWEAAASWWQTFEEKHPDSSALPAARTLHARAAEGLGDKAAAAALLENFSGPVLEPERVARLYRASQLKK